MSIPTDFIFSQNSIQTYLDCPRRFELMFLLRQSWPAPITEPNLEFEKHLKLGERFHLLVQQYLAGIPEKLIEGSIIDPDLSRWWKNYFRLAPQFPPEQCFCEFYQSIPFLEFRLSAKYDLLVIQDKYQMTIIDWKTIRKRWSASSLKKRIQTSVYPLVAHEAHLQKNNRDYFFPENIKMIYWFPEFPSESETIHFTNQLYEDVKEHLTKIIREISRQSIGNYCLTDYVKRCTYCNYRSLCNRGVQAASWADEIENEIYDENYNAEPSVETSMIH